MTIYNNNINNLLLWEQDSEQNYIQTHVELHDVLICPDRKNIQHAPRAKVTALKTPSIIYILYIQSLYTHTLAVTLQSYIFFPPLCWTPPVDQRTRGERRHLSAAQWITQGNKDKSQHLYTTTWRSTNSFKLNLHSFKAELHNFDS